MFMNGCIPGAALPFKLGPTQNVATESKHLPGRRHNGHCDALYHGEAVDVAEKLEIRSHLAVDMLGGLVVVCCVLMLVLYRTGENASEKWIDSDRGVLMALARRSKDCPHCPTPFC